MLGNKALDIVIGLVFIYTLYSLFASTINEFISTILAYRHRMLERGLEQMLDGKNYSYYWWEKIFNFFKWANNSKTLKQQGVMGPSEFLDRKPLNLQTNGTVSRTKLDEKSALFAAQVTNHPLYKRKAENSILFKKPAYLESTAFSDILLDLFHTHKNLPLLLKNIEEEIEKNPLVNAELKNILLIHIRQANGDVNRFKVLIENWYDDTMDRVSGWYKRQTQRIVFTIGFMLAVAFNINTLEIVKFLSVDETTRTALANNAAIFVEKKIRESDSMESEAIKSSIKAPDSLVNKVDSTAVIDTAKGKVDTGQHPKPKLATNFPKDSTNGIDTAGFAKAKQKIAQIKEFYNDEVNDQNKLLGLGWGDYGFKEDSVQYLKDSAEYVRKLKENKLGKKEKKPTPPSPPGNLGKAWFIICQIPKNFIGFIITALAISLGAPFWFDLLNKLVKLRASGQKPADSRDVGVSTTANKTILMNQRPDPTAKG